MNRHGATPLGLVALVFAGTALVLCWIPVINFGALFLALIGAVLGVVSLARGRVRTSPTATHPVQGGVVGRVARWPGIAAVIVAMLAVVGVAVSWVVVIVVGTKVGDRVTHNPQASTTASVQNNTDQDTGRTSQEILASDLRVTPRTFLGPDGVTEPGLPVTVTNTADSARRYEIRMDAIGPDGAIITTSWGDTGMLQAGEARTLQFFLNPDDGQLAALKAAKFSVGTVKEFAAIP